MALFLGGLHCYMAVCQNLVPLVNIKIAGKWMFIPLKMVLIGIDPYPHQHVSHRWGWGSSCSASAAQLEPQLFGRCFWMSGCHPNLGMSSSNGTSKKLAKDGLKMSQRCQIFSRNPHESSSSLELSDQKSWNHGELGTEAPEVSLPRTGPSLRDSGHFWVFVLSPSVLGCPILTYIYRNQENQSLRMSSKLLHEPSVLQVGRTGKRSLSPKLLHAPRLRFTTDMTLARVMLPSDLGAKLPREGDPGISQKGSTTDRWLALKLQKINGHFRNLNWRYLPYTRPM